MFSDKLKKMLNSKNENEGEGEIQEGRGNNKKKIENLVFFVIVLIVTIIIINVILGDNKKTTQQNGNTNSKQLASSNSNTNQNGATIEVSSNSSEELETKLREILKKIQGVGDVNVFINYSESSQTVPMYNENSKSSQTEESDTSGGTRKIAENNTEKEIIYQENNGEKIPITQKVINPTIEGAIITAKGAGDAQVKANIIQAVEAVTGLANHKIQVFEAN